jgi:hypothetical protein
MPKGTGGHRFKKGDPKINRKGAPKIPQDLKLLNQELKVDALKHLYAYWFMKVKTYQDTMKYTDEMTMGERMIGAAYGKAAKDGNLAYVEAILNRILGKPANSDPQTLTISTEKGPNVILSLEGNTKKKPNE